MFVTALEDCTVAVRPTPAIKVRTGERVPASRTLGSVPPAREFEPFGHQPHAEKEEAQAAQQRGERGGQRHCGSAEQSVKFTSA